MKYKGMIKITRAPRVSREHYSKSNAPPLSFRNYTVYIFGAFHHTPANVVTGLLSIAECKNIITCKDKRDLLRQLRKANSNASRTPSSSQITSILITECSNDYFNRHMLELEAQLPSLRPTWLLDSICSLRFCDYEPHLARNLAM